MINWILDRFAVLGHALKMTFGPSIEDVIIERVKARGHIEITIHGDGTVTEVDKRHPNWKQMMIDDAEAYEELNK